MDQLDYWFLDSVLEQRQPLELLLSADVEAWFNRPAHGLARDELAGRLLRLFNAGDLIASDDTRGDFVPTPDELEAALSGEPGAYYGLTPQGGAAWEAVSNPDWNRFIDECYGESDSTGEMAPYQHGEHVGELTCTDKEHLEKYLAAVHFIGVTHLPPSLIRDTLTPWQATYWKTLPQGYRVRFLCVYAGAAEPADIPDWFKTMKDWHTPPLAPPR